MLVGGPEHRISKKPMDLASDCLDRLRRKLEDCRDCFESIIAGLAAETISQSVAADELFELLPPMGLSEAQRRNLRSTLSMWLTSGQIEERESYFDQLRRAWIQAAIDETGEQVLAGKLAASQACSIVAAALKEFLPGAPIAEAGLEAAISEFVNGVAGATRLSQKAKAKLGTAKLDVLAYRLSRRAAVAVCRSALESDGFSSDDAFRLAERYVYVIDAPAVLAGIC